MTARVAIAEIRGDYAKALGQAIRLIDGVEELNSPQRPVVVKVGVFDHAAPNHASVGLVKAIADSFDRALKVFLAESDNYRGKALERLKVWEGLFSDRVVPADLSDESDARRVTLAGQEMYLSNALFKPNVLVSTHILRSFERGSILKKLFGCVPFVKKAKYHGVLPTLLADIYETVGGIDLAVMDGTYFWRGAGGLPIEADTILVGRDAVAVEAVGATLAGLRLEKMPVLQEFVRRGLGEGDLKNIEVLGAPFEPLKAKFRLASKQHA